MKFKNRTEAATLLARELKQYRSKSASRRPLVLAIPRGSVTMARIVAEQLDADLDILLVHKLGAPGNPEYAIGAVAETGAVLRSEAVSALGISEDYIEQEIRAQLQVLQERRKRYSASRPRTALTGRTVIIVDDGLATGYTMLAAARTIRAEKPGQLIIASPVASPSAAELLSAECDEAIYLHVPEDLYAISQFYEEFPQVSDKEVEDMLRPPMPFTQSVVRELVIVDGHARMAGELVLPARPRGLVIFAHGSGSSRFSPRNIHVAARLQAQGLGTFLFDLLSEYEASSRSPVFDIELLSQRLILATRTIEQELKREPGDGRGIAIGYFGASTGAAAALYAAAELGETISAVVSRGGRPDLALDRLSSVKAPTLLLVGNLDKQVLELNRHALLQLRKGQLTVIEGATHLFEEPGTLDSVADYAITWFKHHFVSDWRISHEEFGKKSRGKKVA
ncbi:MAG: hypothetical protein A2070_02610 [Bdellovibrionales bacterium GWC1_52_8]|nr:MAG: hypothetical protein A2X97_14450 [Bdellovibrionales bacterium GWA1_52_35]OFZ43096.1 MAG: hypothetical protein A2070_02610 [Bdellovibrionales bacterium GWC1_52_8]